MNNAVVTIGSARADKAMSKLRDNLKLPTKKIERFTIKAEKSLLAQPLIVSIPSRKLANTVNIIDENTTVALLEVAVSVSPIGSIVYMDNIPINELKDIEIDIFFVPASKDQQTINQLSNALAIASNIKANSSTGKIDYSELDAEMIETLPVGRKLSDYIKNVRKHPIKKLLGVTTRSMKKVGGKDNV